MIWILWMLPSVVAGAWAYETGDRSALLWTGASTAWFVLVTVAAGHALRASRES